MISRAPPTQGEFPLAPSRRFGLRSDPDRILKNKNTITGTASAARIWNTGAIGMAVAYRRYEIALVLSVINILTLRIVKMVKSKVEETVEEHEEEKGS